MAQDRRQDENWNRIAWDKNYAWPQAGDEWSQAWGGSREQWYISIYPRIMRFLPTRSILEIAPGWGRWTRFLIPHCSSYAGFDLSERAILECKKRFHFEKTGNFFVNDGKSLHPTADGSVDFIFSMDSLVHAEVDVIEAYLEEASRVLSLGGIGFVHHSNMAEHAARGVANKHARATSVSAEIFSRICQKVDLCCITQEKIAWFQPETNDCFSLFTHAKNMRGKMPAMISNENFISEPTRSRVLSDAYNFTF